ncbi:MAG: DUF302 domain-containing protein [Anaerolineales bacterium]|nr:DUF302 domain-containing protein [Anaerolineales bacterium]MCA9931416.1 DUF302 domain-containing protein [Anaerolineales bacterium]
MGNLLLGILIGIIVTAVAVYVLTPRLMVAVHKSKLPFAETVDKIVQEAESRDWLVPKVYNLQNTLSKAGYTDMTKLNVISLCKPAHAYKILKPDAQKFITAIMPCRMGVYETADGSVYISEMNMGLMSKLFGKNIGNVISEVVVEESAMLADVISS